jgi:glutamate-5-semialdehyde dehydrogenase
MLEERIMTEAFPIDAASLIRDIAVRARTAAATLARAPSMQKAAALLAAARTLRHDSPAILAANSDDLARGRAAGLSDALVDRLLLNEARIEGIAAALEAVAALEDPVGSVIDNTERPNGLKLSRVRVPLGVVGIIYESRPNVTADAGALALMAGNAVILRGGSEARASNRAIHDCLLAGLDAAALPADAIQPSPIVPPWARC